ncbi:MAG: hypothetical protein SFW36_03495 [Leptolyngbyaceae cyanobacterium bins.59]|nr:hypothetical protein [Leptolyngbyaceae cyanobacterium bins.59]
MQSIINWLKGSGRRFIAIGLAALAFLTIPSLGITQAAYAASPDQPGIKPMSKSTQETLKRIQDKAEDLGDRAERPIGDTGLKNIKKLGENIPETLDLKSRQNKAMGDADNPTVKDLDKAQRKVEKAWKS